MKKYIYQDERWPNFTWNYELISGKLGEVRNLQGKLTGKMESLGFSLREEALLEAISLDVIKSTEIEGVMLPSDQVRSSIARHLGMEVAGLVASDRFVDGVVEMTLDATRNAGLPLSAERLFGWQTALFPTGRSGINKISTGNWRKDETGPMQVVSGGFGKEKVHYQAPPAATLNREMTTFLEWFNAESTLDPVIKAGIAHLWFVTIHPFDDGNGRIARAIADMQLSRADGSAQRFYSMSAQIRLEQKAYYAVLEKTQKGGLDVSEWMQWFLDCLHNALLSAEITLSKVLLKARFWERIFTISINHRQRKMINKLLEGFEGNLTTSKWAVISKCSADTALRDINDLVSKGILLKEEAGGRSTGYGLAGDPDF
jgi:Fic family protein